MVAGLTYSESSVIGPLNQFLEPKTSRELLVLRLKVQNVRYVIFRILHTTKMFLHNLKPYNGLIKNCLRLMRFCDIGN